MLPESSPADDRQSFPPSLRTIPGIEPLAARLERLRADPIGDPPAKVREKPPKRPTIPSVEGPLSSPPARPRASGSAYSPPGLAALVARLAAEMPPINLTSDTLISPGEVVLLLPPRRRGRKAHKSTVFRWFATGYKGLRLPFLQVGGQRCTSVNALQSFLAALTTIARFEQGDSGPACAPTPELANEQPTQAAKRHVRVEDDLRRRHGI